MNPWLSLNARGQSVWLDNIGRRMIEDGTDLLRPVFDRTWWRLPLWVSICSP